MIFTHTSFGMVLRQYFVGPNVQEYVAENSPGKFV